MFLFVLGAGVLLASLLVFDLLAPRSAKAIVAGGLIYPLATFIINIAPTVITVYLVRDFDVSEGTAGLLILSGFAGNVVGTFVSAPMGDFSDRKRMIVRRGVAGSALLVAMGFAPVYWLALVIAFAIGLLFPLESLVRPLLRARLSVHPTMLAGSVTMFLMVGLFAERLPFASLGASMPSLQEYWALAGAMSLFTVLAARWLPSDPVAERELTAEAVAAAWPRVARRSPRVARGLMGVRAVAGAARKPAVLVASLISVVNGAAQGTIDGTLAYLLRDLKFDELLGIAGIAFVVSGLTGWLYSYYVKRAPARAIYGAGVIMVAGWLVLIAAVNSGVGAGGWPIVFAYTVVFIGAVAMVNAVVMYADDTTAGISFWVGTRQIGIGGFAAIAAALYGSVGFGAVGVQGLGLSLLGLVMVKPLLRHLPPRAERAAAASPPEVPEDVPAVGSPEAHASETLALATRAGELIELSRALGLPERPDSLSTALAQLERVHSDDVRADALLEQLQPVLEEWRRVDGRRRDCRAAIRSGLDEAEVTARAVAWLEDTAAHLRASGASWLDRYVVNVAMTDDGRLIEVVIAKSSDVPEDTVLEYFEARLEGALQPHIPARVGVEFTPTP